MDRLGAHMAYYIKARLHVDPAWRGVTAVYSGCDVAGEGEHKIMEHLRGRVGEAANEGICIYGADAVRGAG